MMNNQEVVDYAKSLDCVHCGLCLNTCPTYLATGLESRSPRGRIHLMRSLAEGSTNVDATMVDELDSCLMCRHCEVVCPSGVEYTDLLEHTREALGDHPSRSWLGRQLMRIGLRYILPSRRLTRYAANLLGAGQRLGIVKLLGGLGPLMRSSANLPAMPKAGERRPLDRRYPALGISQERVAILEGCVMPHFFGRVNRSTASVLQACGREVHAPEQSSCCGALHSHNGDLEMARTLAKQTIHNFESIRREDGTPAPVIVNSAGCSAQMKEYGKLLAADSEFAERAQRFAERVKDFSEYIAEEAMQEVRAVVGSGAEKLGEAITYDDPCHLCHAQGISDSPRALLDLLPAKRVELPGSDSCCGSAGLYATLRPEDSQEILEPKLEQLRQSGAKTLITANPGCQLQWQSGVTRLGLDVEVLHIAEAMERCLTPRS